MLRGEGLTAECGSAWFLKWWLLVSCFPMSPVTSFCHFETDVEHLQWNQSMWSLLGFDTGVISKGESQGSAKYCQYGKLQKNVLNSLVLELNNHHIEFTLIRKRLQLNIYIFWDVFLSRLWRTALCFAVEFFLPFYLLLSSTTIAGSQVSGFISLHRECAAAWIITAIVENDESCLLLEWL